MNSKDIQRVLQIRYAITNNDINITESDLFHNDQARVKKLQQTNTWLNERLDGIINANCGTFKRGLYVVSKLISKTLNVISFTMCVIVGTIGGLLLKDVTNVALHNYQPTPIIHFLTK